MRTSDTRAIPPRLEQARRRFERWRRTRKIGSRIPQALWATAVKLAEVYGIHPTARALRVNYYSLKKRMEEEASRSRKVVRASGATFVELAATAQTGMPECVLELEDVEGTKMRMQLRGIQASDLAVLSRSLWGVE